MDIDITRMQDSEMKATREKQCSEGYCFLCNKLGHLKRDCPNDGKGGNPSKLSCFGSTVRTTQVQGEEANERNLRADQMTLPQMDGIMAQMRGLSMEEKDEMIDALIGQETF
jgi:hypothetical protein